MGADQRGGAGAADHGSRPARVGGYRVVSDEVAQAGAGWAEASPLVEVGEMRLEVHVEPIAAGGSDLSCCLFDDGGGDAMAAVVGVDGDVEEEGVAVAVPGEVGEADEPIAGVRCNPPQRQRPLPALPGRVAVSDLGEGDRVEGYDVTVSNRCPSSVDDAVELDGVRIDR